MRARNVRETETGVPTLSLRFFPSTTKATPAAVRVRLTANSASTDLQKQPQDQFVECDCACK